MKNPERSIADRHRRIRSGDERVAMSDVLDVCHHLGSRLSEMEGALPHILSARLLTDATMDPLRSKLARAMIVQVVEAISCRNKRN
jgi:hypothetical protein